MSSHKISLSWIGRILQPRFSAVELTDTNFSFKDSNNTKVTCIPWEQLNRPPEFVWSWLGLILCFNAGGKQIQIPFLGYLSKHKFASLIEDCWAVHNTSHLEKLLAKIDQACTQEYLRHSRLELIAQRVDREYRRWFPWSEARAQHFPQSLQQMLIKLCTIHQWKESDIQQVRDDYVQSQLIKYADFFQSVESNPLTDKQRKACVIDDNNNLLLAGAGTGKTSVMVGRAGYLIESQQASATDILLLAYGKKAADEMDERIKIKLHTDSIKASTFHSLGMKIIAEVEQAKPSLSPWVNDEKAKDKWVHDQLESLILEDDYRKKLFTYFSQYYYVEKSPFEFETEGEYFSYLNDNDIRTLKGEKVKSFGELYIANWLFQNGIEYQYEAKYQHDVRSVDFRQYEPDFYLPELDIYIEYYGIDEEGNTAPYVDQNVYHESMQWKRDLHNQHQTICIELFYHQQRKGNLTDVLAHTLQQLNTELYPLPDEAILETLRELGRVTAMAKLFSQLIGLYKAACLDEQRLQRVLNNAADRLQMTKALELLEPILLRYQQHLSERSEIDFEDMISTAINYVEQGQFSAPWKYIMVDEFQDISEPRARLVRALRDSNAKASVFCVGDDWQAIYRFSGADVSLTTNFTQYFGPTAKTYLDCTFRFNNAIGEVATQFVTQNPVQLKKDIRSFKQVKHAAVSILRRGANQGATNEEPTPDAVTQALAAINNKISNQTSKQKVYLLARFWYQLPDLTHLNALKSQFPNLEIENQSFHASKGKEADYVIIMGLTTGLHGFPSMKVTPPLLDAMLPKEEAFKFAEERRLFYVALTRAKHRAYVLADMTNVSPFVVELIKEKYPIELDEFATSDVQKLFEQINCQQCTTGTLQPRTSKFGQFYSCSHYPLCDHKEKGCPRCSGPMTRKRYKGFKACINSHCGYIAPLCSKCGGDMVLRKSGNKEFWGCSNFRGNEQPSCRNGVDKEKVRIPV
ncbi:UvrD-helicase domain-containing protein [Parashewanella spongiae]|uniref:UvrD-helicase domain-containing protein n=1 Tax=Parashewanella spongiae TaxID=342950 RepID=UPI0026C547C5